LLPFALPALVVADGLRPCGVPGDDHRWGGVLVSTELRAPFPWFGGKGRVAHVVWQAFGNPPNYVEPFFGSGAVLLRRPTPGKIETINDLDCDVANFWRATQKDPAAVAEFADYPVNEADQHARCERLLERLPAHRERMHLDPDYFDAERAGMWCWGQSTAIGGNWMNPKGRAALPRLCGWVSGNGIHAARAGAPSPGLGHSGRGVHRLQAGAIEEWFELLAARLRRVRVACGEWSRVLSGAVTGASNSLKNMGMSPCAVFLDPPYGGAGSDREVCYSQDSLTVSADARAWAIEHGNDPHFRIALCGYEGEHELPEGWRCFAWKAQGGHANRSRDNKNRHRERIWFSPHCLDVEAQQSLFEGGSVSTAARAQGEGVSDV
jgi:DNA adenine methylase